MPLLLERKIQMGKNRFLTSGNLLSPAETTASDHNFEKRKSLRMYFVPFDIRRIFVVDWPKIYFTHVFRLLSKTNASPLSLWHHLPICSSACRGLNWTQRISGETLCCFAVRSEIKKYPPPKKTLLQNQLVYLYVINSNRFRLLGLV